MTWSWLDKLDSGSDHSHYFYFESNPHSQFYSDALSPTFTFLIHVVHSALRLSDFRYSISTQQLQLQLWKLARRITCFVSLTMFCLVDFQSELPLMIEGNCCCDQTSCHSDPSHLMLSMMTIDDTGSRRRRKVRELGRWPWPRTASRPTLIFKHSPMPPFFNPSTSSYLEKYYWNFDQYLNK